MSHWARIPKRQLAIVSTLAISALVLTACGITKKEEPPPCPQVVILADAAKATKYRGGSGRDITDIEYEAELSGFTGSCGYDKKRTQVEVAISAAFFVARGPAGTGPSIDLPYFVAIPDQAKQVFTAKVEFPGSSPKVRHVDDEVSVTIPLSDGELGTSTTIYLGLQLTPEQLEFNRKLKK